MNILIQNISDTSSVFVDEIKKSCNVTTNLDKADVVFTEWVPKTTINYIKSNLQKKKTFIVFDKFLMIEPDDANWLRKQSVILTEPALNFRRKYFFYIPFWVKFKNIDDINLNEGTRPYDLAYKGDMQGKIQSFKDYYVAYARKYPKTVFYENKNISKNDNEKYNTYGLVGKDVINYKDVKVTMIIGSALDYEIGYLDYHFFEALNDNCIPFIVNEHKYFSLLSPYTLRINNDPSDDINYLVAGYDNSYIGYSLGIYEVIKKYYPEMLVENVISQILDLL